MHNEWDRVEIATGAGREHTQKLTILVNWRHCVETIAWRLCVGTLRGPVNCQTPPACRIHAVICRPIDAFEGQGLQAA